MTTAAPGSTLPRRMLGRALKRLREQAGTPPGEAARAIGVSSQTLWRIETGQQKARLKELYVQVLCLLYGVAKEETRVLVGLVELCDRKSWVHLYEDVIPQVFELFIGLEEAAVRVTTFQLSVVPGLLQTADYRRAGILAEAPTASPTEVERQVELTAQRQSRIYSDENPLEVVALLDESVLRRQIGGPSVMVQQIQHLLKLSRLPNVSIRVVPLGLGMHIGLQVGDFVLLEFPPHPTVYLSEPPVVYVDGFTGALYLERETEVRQYRLGLRGIGEVALGDIESKNLMTKIAREYEA